MKKIIQRMLSPKKIKSTFTPSNDKMKVHLGSGEVDIKGFINIDARDMKHIHIVKNDLFLNEFVDETLEMIYMCHVLEHVSHKDVVEYLKHYYNKLKTDGILRLSVPDFDKIIQIYNASGKVCDSIKTALMGGQGYAYNYHYSVFNAQSLTSLLEEAGFKTIRVWNPKDEEEFNNVDWSSRKINYDFGKFEISLNIEAVK